MIFHAKMEMIEVETEILKKKLIDKLIPLSVEKSKIWWENYVKHGSVFRGVGIPVIRDNLKLWYEEEKIEEYSCEDQLTLALSFFEEKCSEDKIAGILMLQLFLYDKIAYTLLLHRFEELFSKNLISDWNVCDWFCVRVLGPMIQTWGDKCADEITAWKGSANVWQARCSLVAFAKLARKGNYTATLLGTAAVLIRREERFAKTAVGWILRELSGNDRTVVRDFISQYGAYFTGECLNNALKYFDKEEKKRIIRKIKT